ncbi:RNA helicase [Ranunculus cassubicifolius]
MPTQILPLRVLSNSISFSTMKMPTTNIQQISIFTRVFPFKAKYLGFPSINSNGVRRLSSGSFRGGRTSSINSEFSRRSNGVDRGNVRGGGFAGRVGQAKSLIEDEDDLNNWVSGLKPDSFGLSSGSDEDSGGGRGSFRGRDSGSSRGSRDGEMGRGSFRGRDSGGRGRGGEMGRSSFRDRDSGRGRGGDSFRDRDSGRGRGGEMGRDSFRDRDSGRGRGRGGSLMGQRGRRGSYSDFRRPRESDSDDFDVSDRRSSRGSSSFSRGSRGSMTSRRRDSDSDMDFAPRRETSLRSSFSSAAKRGGRDSETSYSRGGSIQKGRKTAVLFSDDDDEDEDDDDEDDVPMKRGGRNSVSSSGRGRGSSGVQKGRKLAAFTSDEDGDEDDIDSSFGDLLSDNDSDGDDSEDEEMLPKKRGQAARGAVSSPMKNSGKDSGRVLQKGKKQALHISSEDEEDDGPIPSFTNFLNDEESEEDDVSDVHVSAKKDNTSAPKISSGASDSYLSGTRFDECAISPLSLKGIKDAGYEKMTVVQEATLPIILKGKDVLAKARTGTGKTVAFLLPAIETIVKSPPVDRDQKRPPVFVLVICPTRELASQAAAEATKLLKYHPSIGVQIVIGGVRLALEQKRLQANPCQILVATPGRLKDHIENTAGFATRLMGVKVLILDEADHLLDMGFRKDIEKIISAVPKQRQTLLFSATVPPDVRQICHVALKRDHEFINTVEEGSEETHTQVKQTHLVAPLDKQFSLLYALLKDHISDDIDFKVLVFCTTAMVTRLVAELLSELKLNVREIHSRKPQSYRTRVSDEFRKSKGLILVTSDVSARGVDYPDVTLVIQIGVPADREQYIHRLGRTGRKGKEGLGVLMLAPWEEAFLSSVRDLPLTKAEVPLVDPDTRKKVERAMSNVEMKNKEAAYQAWLGYYNSNKIVSRDKCRVVELANEFSRCMGLDNPPAIAKLIIGKMGLKNVPGLRIK